MASMRVHELAKEFGMTSKELLDRLEQMKIPAKNHASTLVDAYVDKIRKVLGPELAERAAAIEAAAAAKAAEAKKEEEKEREVEEAARKVADEAEHARRDAERRERGDFEEPTQEPEGSEQPASEMTAAPEATTTPAVISAPGVPVSTPSSAPVSQNDVEEHRQQTIPSAAVTPADAAVTAAPSAADKVEHAVPVAVPTHEAPRTAAAVTPSEPSEHAVTEPQTHTAVETHAVSASPKEEKVAAHTPVRPSQTDVAERPLKQTPAHGQASHEQPAKPAGTESRTARPQTSGPSSAQHARQAAAQHVETAKTPGMAPRNAEARQTPSAKQKPAPVRIPTSSGASRFDSLLSQIAAEQSRLNNVAAQKAAAKSTAAGADHKRREAPGHTSTTPASTSTVTAPADHKTHKEVAIEDDRKNLKHVKKAHGKDEIDVNVISFTEEEETEGEGDRYTKMAKEAERFQRNKVIADAKAAVEAASSEGEGRRRRRKEKRVAEKAAIEEQKVEQAILRGEAPVEAGTIMVPTGSTVAEFSELIGAPSNDIIKRLFLLGNPLTLTQTISDDLIELIADDLGRKIKVTVPEEQQQLVFYDDPKDLVPRSPVVTVMGHVDHGKTSLLDAIRSTDVVKSEAGGITQRIGASVVHINGRQITFIDTPGHEAFTAMRARGAKITDVVVLVVAADDGVMPQTIEAIHHAEAAGVPIVVAVNKIDKPGADPSRVRQELTTYGIVAEEWGGQNMFVDVSAKKHIGIDDLLETILLQADVLELKANPKAPASGFVIEAKLDKGRGPVATVLVHRGTLKVGDALVVGTAYGRVRAMLDPKGNNVDQALPADPVEVLGLSSVPDAGDEFRVFDDERDARDLAEERALRRRLKEQSKTKISLDNLFDRMKEGEKTELNLIVKADVQGSIEALQDALDKMDQKEVKINVIHSAVGGITETDVTLASASDAIIIGFGVRPQPKAKIAAEREKVDIRCYRVIYEAIDEINAARVGLLQPEEVEVDVGAAEVRSLFRVPKVGVVAGCYVTEGEMTRDGKIRVVRDGTIVYEGVIGSLRRFKDDVKSVKTGYECGIGIDGFQDIHESDIIENYRIDKVARKE